MTTPDSDSPDTPAHTAQGSSRLPEPGETFHFLATGMTFQLDDRETSGVVAIRGQEYVLTEAMIEANRNARGCSFLELLHDSEAQRRIYGRPLVGPGPWPDDEERTEPGTLEHEDARHEALDTARQIPDKTDRAEAMRRVKERFGAAPATSRTMASYK